ncbi:MAG: substrate-binding domain-containing protein [Spirochaetales bacterium]|uniref:Substrate-binding domain-containing protein n=1 Tax=Candidatus Thalassospirochaeta sargassi TaxID=3119039 RepID=A0AAJ1IDC3_9SPIO|nr:substrate-binding domain-containing protein [Spirochaetales bacterium]
MSKYQEYLAELKSATLFQNIEDEALLNLLDVMNPEIVCRKAGTSGIPFIDFEKGLFNVVVKGKPLEKLETRPDIYNMPKPNEPGMMMGEIPCLSEMHKSRAPLVKLKGPPPRGPKHDDFDLYLMLMSGEMLTKFYGEQYADAQGKMLRNFLGILAQKVTDVRREKSEAITNFEKELAPYRLNVLCAGVSMRLVFAAAEQWNAENPEYPAVVTPGGSVDLIRDCIGGAPCDLLISADDEIVRSMMMPEYAAGYRIWAGNKMVVTGEGISSDNWEERLLADDATFKHHDPYGDPGGYRAVMSMLLADAYKPGLSDKLMNHPGHIGMEKETGPFGNMKQAKYNFIYRTVPIATGADYAELPPIMDLSDPELADEYAKISFAIDEHTEVPATPIAHALTVPKASLHKEAAKEFARLFLSMVKESDGFLPRQSIVGEDPLK